MNDQETENHRQDISLVLFIIGIILLFSHPIIGILVILWAVALGGRTYNEPQYYEGKTSYKDDEEEDDSDEYDD